MSRTSRWLPPVMSAAVAMLGLAVAPAEAATYTSTGVRCTIVGTPYRDNLSGTGSRDVMCGLGGNDVITGSEGNDVLDGGPGADDLYAFEGDDLLLGGDGADHLRGFAGADVLRGGAGIDRLQGGDGADVLKGGADTDYCSAFGDAFESCVNDERAPVLTLLSATASVDVSAGPAATRFRVRATDRTGVRGVWLQMDGGEVGTMATSQRLRRVSGTDKDGTWQLDLTIPAGHPDITESFDFTAVDHFDRYERHGAPGSFRIIDANPDAELPRVEVVAPAPLQLVDTRDGARTLTVDLHVTDQGTGTHSVAVVLWSPPRSEADYGYGYDSGSGIGLTATLVSGTRWDGRWRATYTFPQGTVAGDWGLAVGVTDRARPWSHFGDWSHWSAHAGPYTTYTRHQGQPFPDGAGRFRVLGSGDGVPPTVTDLSVDDSTVRHGQGQYVRVRLRAPDVGAGTKVVSVRFVSDSGAATYPGWSTTPDAEGFWNILVSFPAELPVGTYRGAVFVKDLRNFRLWTSSTIFHADDPTTIRSDAVPTVRVTLL